MIPEYEYNFSGCFLSLQTVSETMHILDEHIVCGPRHEGFFRGLFLITIFSTMTLHYPISDVDYVFDSNMWMGGCVQRPIQQGFRDKRIRLLVSVSETHSFIRWDHFFSYCVQCLCTIYHGMGHVCCVCTHFAPPTSFFTYTSLRLFFFRRTSKI